MDRHSFDPAFRTLAHWFSLAIYRQLLQDLQRAAIFCPIDDFAKDGVFAIEVRQRCIGDEELRLACIRPARSHRDDASRIELMSRYAIALQV